MKNSKIQQPLQVGKHSLGISPYYPSLDLETRTAISTDAAAFHLNRKQQTLRRWACCENGPLKPIRINGRLAWPVSELKDLLNASPNRSNQKQIKKTVAEFESSLEQSSGDQS